MNFSAGASSGIKVGIDIILAAIAIMAAPVTPKGVGVFEVAITAILSKAFLQ